MKTLIQNYSTALSSESFSIANSLLAVQSEAILWADSSISAFDMFDRSNPDVFFTHALYLTEDVLKRLSNTDIEVVLNVTSVSPEDMARLDGLLKDFNIKCPLMFSNQVVGSYEIPENHKFIRVLPAADIFLPAQNVPAYSIPELIIFSRDNENVKTATDGKEVYHMASFGEGFDIQADVVSLASFYDKYDRVTIADDVSVCCSQLFFDATLRSKAMSIEVVEDQRPIFNQFIDECFGGEETEKEESVEDFIKSKIRNSHTCVHRTRQIFNELGNQDLCEKLEKLSDHLVG